MRFTVVTSWPRPSLRPWAATGRFLAIVLGLGLLVVAAIVSVLPLYSMVYPIAGPWIHPDLSVVELLQRSPTPLDELGIPLPLQMILAVACFFAGRQLLRGRRYVVLFLRRFGHRESTKVVSAAARRIGRRWRFITLDDASIAPMGAGTAAKAASAAAAGIAVAATIAQRAGTRTGWLLERPLAAIEWLWDASRDALVSVWKWASIGAVAALLLGTGMRLARTGDLNAVETIVDADGPWFVESYVFAVGTLVLSVLVVLPLAVAVMAMAIVLVSINFVRPILLGLAGVFFAMTDAEKSRAVALSTAEAVLAATTQLEENRHNVFRPRLAVFKVDSSIWQQTVLELAEESTAILIDVSEPTANVLWEIEQLSAAHLGRCVLVGDAGRLRHLASGELRDPDEIRLAELNEGQTVLAYTADRRGIRRFRSALRRRLTATAPSNA